MKSQKVCPNEYEHQYWPLDKVIVGIDEAGRGPLAGPLTVAGVVFPIGYENPDIYDSKSISEKSVMRYLNKYKRMRFGLKSFRYHQKILINTISIVQINLQWNKLLSILMRKLF